MPGFEDLTDSALAQPIANQIRTVDQLLRSADKNLVHLKYAEPAALDQILGQRSHITEARAQHAIKLIELVGGQESLFLNQIDECGDGINGHRINRREKNQLFNGF